MKAQLLENVVQMIISRIIRLTIPLSHFFFRCARELFASDALYLLIHEKLELYQLHTLLSIRPN